MNSGSKDLDALRETASKALISLLWLHVPIAAVIGMARGTDWLMPTILMIAFAAAATLSWRSVGNGLSTHLVIAVALMGGVSVFTFQLSGHAWQVDSHMYFFAALASLAAYCDYRPIIPEQSRSRCIIWRSISSCRRQFIPAAPISGASCFTPSFSLSRPAY